MGIYSAVPQQLLFLVSMWASYIHMSHWPLPAKNVHTVQYINERTVVVQIQYIFVFLFLRQLTCNRFVLKFKAASYHINRELFNK